MSFLRLIKMGDSSDNIPGVKGIGEKTAIQLLSKYGSLDGVYEHLNEISPKTREKLENDKDNAYKSYNLATIYREVPLDFQLEDCKYMGYNPSEFKKQLEELEFYSLLKKLDFSSTSLEKEEKVEDKEIVIEDINSFSLKDYSFYVETRGSVYSKSTILGVGIYDGEKGYFISAEEIEKYKEIFNSDVSKYTYDLKRCLVVCSDIAFKNVTFDTMIAAYLLDYVVKDDISFVARSFDVNIPDYESLYGTDKRPKDISLE